ncbi:MAG: phosphatidylcholine synthase [Bacteroidetes bacterium]|nr:MAG: phosphatidylcholine synthase [Bacteroidota bacterium]
MRDKRGVSTIRKAGAWAVHLFTASGIVSGFLALVAIADKDWRTAMFWLIVGLFIDGVDGTLARRVGVAQALPGMNGKNIDYVIDFANYALIPACFFYAAPLVEPGWRLPLTCLILLVSALYYGKENMVADEQYFVGFPVLWNLAVFYMVFVFDWPSWGNAAFVMVLAALHFAPIRTAYPSRTRRFKVPTLLISVVAGTGMVASVYYFPEKILALRWLMTGCFGWFIFLTIFDTWIRPTSPPA